MSKITGDAIEPDQAERSHDLWQANLGALTEDQEKKSHDRIQEMTDKFTKQVDEILSAKEKEILEI